MHEYDFFHIFMKYASHSWCKSFRKYQVSIFRCYLGCAPHTQSWVFFQNVQNTAFLLLYYSACKKATAMVFIWGDRRYPAIRFEYKTASELYLVAELQAKQFWLFFQNGQNTAILLLYYSASKKAVARVLIWGDTEYPVIRFEYKTASEWYSVAEI